MKIAIWHNLGKGGARRHLYNHVQGLVARGHEIEIWSPDKAANDYLPLGHVAKEHVLPFVSKPKYGIGPIAAAWNYYRANPLRMMEAMIRHSQEAAKQINDGGFDVLLGTNCTLYSSPFIARYINIPTALYLHEPGRRLYEASPDNIWAALPKGASLRNRLSSALDISFRRQQVAAEIQNAKAFDRILVNSLFNRENVLRAYGCDATLCYQGIDLTAFSASQVPMAERKHILGVGAFGWHKNIAFAIDAVASMPEPRPKLLWVSNSGKENERKVLEQKAQSLGVDFDVRYDISDEELIALYHQARAFIFCSRLEPFGLTPLEANACGVPVVATREGGMRETVVDGVNGLLVDHDPAAAGRALQCLVDDESLASELSAGAVLHVHATWGLDDAVLRLEKQLNEVATANA